MASRLEANERVFAKGVSINLDNVLQFIKAVVEFNISSLQFGYTQDSNQSPLKLSMKQAEPQAPPSTSPQARYRSQNNSVRQMSRQRRYRNSQERQSQERRHCFSGQSTNSPTTKIICNNGTVIDLPSRFDEQSDRRQAFASNVSNEISEPLNLQLLS